MDERDCILPAVSVNGYFTVVIQSKYFIRTYRLFLATLYKITVF